MKKLILVVVVCFGLNTVSAQNAVKDKLVLKGDLIEATLYHDNGEVAQTGFYTKTNKLQGEWVSYDIEGNKTAVAQYDNGQKVGTWFFYEGNTMKEVDFNNSRIAEVKTWEITDTRVVSN